MMNKLVKITIGILIFIAFLILVFYIILLTQKPQYSGTVRLNGLKKPVEVLFDDYGVPHIYGKSEEDTYFAFGYLHAQERLFQMEMMRRVSAGRLSEIFGSKLLEVDKFFRMLGISKHAEESAQKFLSGNDEKYQKAAMAYLAGINSFIENGKTPIEFRLIGIPKEKYTTKDMYLIVDYMSFLFQMAFKTDPLMSKISKNNGEKYLADLAIGFAPGQQHDPMYYHDSIARGAISFQQMIEKLPVPVWLGSNSWAISPVKSKSGKVIFENDTHIGYSQPATWYEAYLDYPGFSFYGSFIAGFPFAPVGHTTELAWGLTIFENDDLDFFREQTDTSHKDMVWFIDHWEKMELRTEIIKVKDSLDVNLTVRNSHHGPVCSDVINDFKEVTDYPVSASWTFLKFPTNLLDVFYQLDHSNNIDDTRKAASLITAPGLNFIYGDAKGNIAWWAAAKLVKRPAHVNSNLLLDGASGKDEWLGWYDFKDNPQSENPLEGFVCSANNQPGSVNGILYPGYYTPADRSLRISEMLKANKKFDADDMYLINRDVTSISDPVVAQTIMNLTGDQIKNKSSQHKRAAEILTAWNGEHKVNDIAPTIYYKLVYTILFNAMSDEMGEKEFKKILSTHAINNMIPSFMKNDSSVWWDNILTKINTETRKEIFEISFDQSVNELETQLGKNPDKWTWGKVHTLEEVHPIGIKKPFNKFFNVGPFALEGGNETINQQGFYMNKEGLYHIKFGPAMRRVIDFADPENGRSVLPTGQSGNFMSRHYADQADLFIKNETRKEMMNRKEIEEKCKDKLTLQPQ